MKKILVPVIFSALTLGAIPAGLAEEGNLTGQILRSVVQGAVGSQEGVSAQDTQWLQSTGSRMDAIDRRVERGMERGDLSRREGGELKDELNDLLDDIDRMKKEGQISQREKDGINRALDKLERKVPGEQPRNAKRKRY